MDETLIVDGDLEGLAGALDAIAGLVSDAQKNASALAAVASGMPGAQSGAAASAAGEVLDATLIKSADAIEGDAGNVRVTDAEFQDTDVTSAGTYKDAPVDSNYRGY
ncbi:hypothetical protein [Gulosibacter bifidus]|uniref:Uncharacterized protein n=1 Tax=Gulosibacter bifidus TaxID=272239 RepID=A0ABW5RHY4_9MICO|nr:hypothetical protein [Gulosibacter bifidus]